MPGPKPQYQPRFKVTEVEEAQAVVRRTTASQSQVRRARLVLLLSETPAITCGEAAHQLQAHPKFVKKWRRRWATTGFSLVDAPRPGRPRIFSPEGGGRGQEGRLSAARRA